MSTVPTLTTGIVDLHHSDGAYDLDVAKRDSGLVALIHKATEGGDFVDPLHRTAMQRAKEHGLLRGLYHFANGNDPAKQAAHFLARVKDFPSVLLILDHESNERSTFGTMRFADACTWVQIVKDATGRWPLYYTYESMLFASMAAATSAQRAVIRNCPLWIAKYGPPPKPMPAKWGAWETWVMWQYSSTMDNGPSDQRTYPRGFKGFRREVQDRSVFRGTVDELQVAWKTWGLPLEVGA